MSRDDIALTQPPYRADFRRSSISAKARSITCSWNDLPR
jgi:hypothetical protein